MTREEIYDAWNPQDSQWILWCNKTVLFPYLQEESLQAPLPVPEQWRLLPRLTGEGIVADVPGVEGLSIGVSRCSAAGFRPVLVYDACPLATYDSDSLSSFAGDLKPAPLIPVAVDLSTIMSTLASASERLIRANLPADAPPAFLIDGNRKGRRWIMQPQYEWFDNRSFVTTSDFPSAHALRDRGMSKTTVIQSNSKIQADLFTVLLTWQNDGISIWRQRPWQPWKPILMNLKRPFLFVRLWNRIMFEIEFRRNQFAPFGQYVPPSSS